MRSADSAPLGRTAGETLLMVLTAVAIVAILAGMLAPVLADKLDDARLRAERGAVDALREDFMGTLDATDFNGTNESSVPSAGLPTGTVFTTFDTATAVAARLYAPTITVDPAGWATKLAVQRGITTAAAGSVYGFLPGNAYTQVAFNGCGLQRCLVLGPAGEVGLQRYLLLSLLVPANRVLPFPAGDPTQLFDSLWDNSWESTTAQAPASWASLLTAGQYALWNSVASANRTNASRLIVARIVQPKYTVTVADTSPTDAAWVDLGPATAALTAAPGAGTVSSASLSAFAGGVLAGRLIVVRRGPSAAAAYEVERFFLNSDVTITVQ